MIQDPSRPLGMGPCLLDMKVGMLIVPCSFCEGLGVEYREEEDVRAVYPALRERVVECWIEDPPSPEIARLLNELDRMLTSTGDRGHSRTCVHGRDPCISRCGVSSNRDGWAIVSKDERVRWYQHMYTLRPHRRDRMAGCFMCGMVAELDGLAPCSSRPIPRGWWWSTSDPSVFASGDESEFIPMFCGTCVGPEGASTAVDESMLGVSELLAMYRRRAGGA